MRRIDVLGITLGVFAAGGVIYWLFKGVGFDSSSAGIWSQALLVIGLIGWIGTYLFRVASHKMTYNQQLDDYEAAFLQKRLDEMTPDELAQLQSQLDQELDLDQESRQ
jgi:hypothetical protein